MGVNVKPATAGSRGCVPPFPLLAVGPVLSMADSGVSTKGCGVLA